MTNNAQKCYFIVYFLPTFFYKEMRQVMYGDTNYVRGRYKRGFLVHNCRLLGRFSPF
jgi:hypothetical protein